MLAIAAALIPAALLALRTVDLMMTRLPRTCLSPGDWRGGEDGG
jgi:hypothetical protein